MSCLSHTLNLHYCLPELQLQIPKHIPIRSMSTAFPIVFYKSLHISVNKPCNGADGLTALPLSYFTVQILVDALEKQQCFSDSLSLSSHPSYAMLISSLVR